MYVRRYCLDTLGMLAEHERRSSDRAQARAERGSGG